MNKPQKPLTLLNRSLIPTFTKVNGQTILTITESRTYWINDPDFSSALLRIPNGSPFRQGVVRNLRSLVRNLRSLAGLDSNDETWQVSGSDTAPVVTMAKTRRIKPEDFPHLTIDPDDTVWDVFIDYADSKTKCVIVNLDTGELIEAAYEDRFDNDTDLLLVIEAYMVKNKLLILRV